MICAYSEDFGQFQEHCVNGTIATVLAEGFSKHYGYYSTESETNSWRNSLPAIAACLDWAGVENGVHVFLELQMPLSSARCDMLLVGRGENGTPSAVVVELKQDRAPWRGVRATASS
jgi:hypothetical protein